MGQEVNDAQWGLIAPHLPPKERTGWPRADDRRIVKGIPWVLRTGALARCIVPARLLNGSLETSQGMGGVRGVGKSVAGDSLRTRNWTGPGLHPAF